MSQHWNPAANEVEEKLGTKRFSKLSRETKVISSRPAVKLTGVDPLVTPIYQSSVYRIKSVQHYAQILQKEGYIYQRLGNPTNEAAEIGINQLEGGQGTILYNSGMAAISDVFTTFLKAGDHMIVQNPMYSGSTKLVQNILTKFGVTYTCVAAGSALQFYKDAIKENTKMIFCETPCNPLLTITNLDGLGQLSSDKIMTVVDGTFASPFLQQSLKHSIDISLHSCTKYIGGHTDLIAGCATVRQAENWKLLKITQSMTGSALSAVEAANINRGLKTLALRMKRHSENAIKVANFLESQAQVQRVFYPGLRSHPQHHLAKSQMSDFGGMITFELADLESAINLVEGVQLINLAVSLGGTESLIEHPASMTHGPMLYTQKDREIEGITDGLIRLSVGLENTDDIIDDLKQAIEKSKRL